MAPRKKAEPKPNETAEVKSGPIDEASDARTLPAEEPATDSTPPADPVKVTTASGLSAEPAPESVEPVPVETATQDGQPEPIGTAVSGEEPSKVETAAPQPSPFDPKPEPEVARQPTPETSPPPPPPRRSGGSGVGTFFLAIVLLALGLGAGYLASREGGPLSTTRVDAVEAAQRDYAGRLEALEKGQASLSGTVKDLPSRAELAALNDRVSGLDSRLADLGKAVEAATTGLDELRNAPPPGLSDEEKAAYQKQLDAMQQMFQKELDDIRARSEAVDKAAAEARQAGASAEALAAVAEIKAGLDTGTAFTSSLDSLAGLNADYPVEPLRAAAQGVSTLPDLQRDFAAAARAELSAQPEGTGVGGFLRSQLGLRSLSPRAGDEPDAILSRAEAALKVGNLSTAITELQTLPGERPQLMADWISRAQARVDAEAAYGQLAQKVQG